MGKQDIVACIPDFIPSFHCSANLIPVTMAVEHRFKDMWSFVRCGSGPKYHIFCNLRFACFHLMKSISYGSIAFRLWQRCQLIEFQEWNRCEIWIIHLSVFDLPGSSISVVRFLFEKDNLFHRQKSSLSSLSKGQRWSENGHWWLVLMRVWPFKEAQQ